MRAELLAKCLCHVRYMPRIHLQSARNQFRQQTHTELLIVTLVPSKQNDEPVNICRPNLYYVRIVFVKEN